MNLTLLTSTMWDNIISPRSKLYCLEPYGVGTLWVESVSGYTNRLGWVHMVPPRLLARQEVVPYLSDGLFREVPVRFTAFCYRQAMTLNGRGKYSRDWARILESLTLQRGLEHLTIQQWFGTLIQSSQSLRPSPAWCPRCYAAWQEASTPIYQPLVWMLRFVTMCTKHCCPLEMHCPNCGKQQAVISGKRFAGHCTFCTAWLGAQDTYPHTGTITTEDMQWHTWVRQTLDELQIAYASPEGLSWKHFAFHLRRAMEEYGSYTTLMRLTGINRPSLYDWTTGTSTPTFESVLNLCYVCNVTPWQVITNQVAPLVETLKNGTSARSPRQAKLHNPVDREECLALMHAVLEGREEAMSMRQIAKRLGCDANTIKHHFPQEYALVVMYAGTHRRHQREAYLVRVCEEVRQAVFAIHRRGEMPTHSKVHELLTNPSVMRMPETRAAWREARQELGLDQ